MNLSIALDKHTPYFPGEAITGKVLYVKNSEFGDFGLSKVLGIEIQFKGKCSVRFTVIDLHMKGRWRTNSTSEYYFNSSYFLIGDGTDEVAELANSGGVREYPFNFQIPRDLPSSYKGTHGAVEYTVTATVKKSWGVNKEYTLPFTVNAKLDISTHPQARLSAMSRKTEKIGMLWWKGPILVNFSMKRRGYVPGEFVQFNAQICNESSVKIHKAKLLLTQECKYMAQGGSHTVTHIIKKVKGPSVAPGNSTLWENNALLKVPNILPPTNLGGNSRLIEINYYLHIIVQPRSIAIKDKTVTCKLPLIIGTRRGPACRDSYPGGAHTSYSLNRGMYPPMGSNRVGSIYGDLGNSGPGSLTSTLSRFTGTMPRIMPGAEYSYYQNVVFPLVRHSSAPIYENYRFPCARVGPPYGTTSPFGNQECLEETFEDAEDGEQRRYEEPPTYEEAMRLLFQTQNTSPAAVIPEEYEFYQNSLISQSETGTIIATDDTASDTTMTQQPVYNNY